MQIKCIIVMIMFLITCKSTVLGQRDTSAEVTPKVIAEPSSTNDKKEIVNEDSLSYSPATYPGGNTAFMRYLISHLIMAGYSTQKTDVSILVTFTIEESGKLNNFRASDGPEPLKKEAIRVVKDSGPWIPAIRDGKPIRSEGQQKITFKLN